MKIYRDHTSLPDPESMDQMVAVSTAYWYISQRIKLTPNCKDAYKSTPLGVRGLLITMTSTVDLAVLYPNKCTYARAKTYGGVYVCLRSL